jgi:hypothetical protein
MTVSEGPLEYPQFPESNHRLSLRNGPESNQIFTGKLS